MQDVSVNGERLQSTATEPGLIFFGNEYYSATYVNATRTLYSNDLADQLCDIGNRPAELPSEHIEKRFLLSLAGAIIDVNRGTPFPVQWLAGIRATTAIVQPATSTPSTAPRSKFQATVTSQVPPSGVPAMKQGQMVSHEHTSSMRPSS